MAGSANLAADIQWGARWQAGIEGILALRSVPRDGWHQGNGLAITGFGLEARRYFRTASGTTASILGHGSIPAPFTGWYAGTDFHHLKFDCLRSVGKVGCEGILYTAGVTGGYTLRIASNWTIDGAIGVGYIYRRYNRYVGYAPDGLNRYLGTKKGSTFGLTHAEISAAYHF
ncbi:MAG: DUF3575 domain-containing protein [Bacteroides sp.]|nr:DUF3575 domain-containing protein [Bacteroides sp.]